MGQSDLEKANDILGVATNATANSTADAMKKAEDLLSSAPKPAPSTEINETSHTYENPRLSRVNNDV